MSSCPRWSRVAVVAAAIACARPGFGAPALTTIQDVLYKADGTRFNGTISITWTNFQAGDASTIPTQAITVLVVNGAFKVQLVPTTNASAGANYSVRYNSQGKFQFSETWAVPPSATPLRVRDVRTGTGSVVGTPPVITQMLISDISGLSNELSLRPTRGVGYQPARAAVIGSSGQIESAQGDLSDCVRVDGSSGPCGAGGEGGGLLPSFIDAETPGGIVDGVNTTFTLRSSPSPAASVALYRNGLLLRQNLDYSLANAVVTFVSASIPQPGDVITVSYRTAGAAGSIGSYSSPQVVCSAAGSATSALTPAELGSCSLSAGVLQDGDRVEIRFDYAHQGSSGPFSATVTWGASTLLAAGGSANEPFLAGRISLAVHSGGAQWTTESWHSTGGPTLTAGNAPDSILAPIPIRLQGQLTASGDSLRLHNFTVVRYPAQVNP